MTTAPTHAQPAWRTTIGEPLAWVGGAGLCLALFAGLWMFGSTRAEGARILAFGLLGSSVVGLAGCQLIGLRCPIPRWLLALVGAGLLAGWWQVLAGPILEPDDYTRAHLARLVARWPKSMVDRTPWVLATQAAGLVGTFVLAATLSARRVWRFCFAGSVVMAVLSVAILGLWQNFCGAATMLNEPRGGMAGYFFGTLFHHTGAGAMINLALPLSATLGIGSLTLSSGRRAIRVISALLWLGAFGILIAAHLGHISRLPQVLGLFTLLLLAVAAVPRLRRGPLHRRLPLLLVGLLLTTAVFFISRHTDRLVDITNRWSLILNPEAPAAARSIDWPPPQAEWNRIMPDDLAVRLRPGASDRKIAWEGALHLAAVAGPLGFGPGSWTAAASHEFNEPFIRTFFLWVQFAHNDFLQLVIEWGWIAGLAVVFVVAGAFRRTWPFLMAVTRRGRPFDLAARITMGSALCLLAVSLQSLVDFPLQIASLQALFAVHLGLCWGAPSTPDQPAAPGSTA